MTVSHQVGDQTLKGAVVGAVAYILAKLNVSPEAQASFLPLVLWALAYVSTRIGDPTVASFFAKAPAVVEEVATAVAEKNKAEKAPAKKAVAKKAPAKKA